MARQLDAMRNGESQTFRAYQQLITVIVEEIQLRESFFAEHGANLPEDLCLCVANMPTRWEVGPALGEAREELPTIDEDLLLEVSFGDLLFVDGYSVLQRRRDELILPKTAPKACELIKVRKMFILLLLLWYAYSQTNRHHSMI